MNEFPRGWHIAKLGELVDNFDAQRRPIKSIDRVPGPNPYYGASGIIDSVDGYTHDGEFLLVAEDGENLRTRATPMAFMASGKIWVNNHAHVLAGKSGVITRFLCYRLSATDISGYLTGTTQPKLSRSAVDSIPILIPPISVQMGVVEVLKALDDKIAANCRVAEISERLAVAHFSSQSRSYVSNGCLGDLLSLEYGKALPSSMRVEGEVPVFGSGGVGGWHYESLIPGPAVIVGRKGTVGATYWSHGPAFPIDTTFYVVPTANNVPLEYCFYLLRSLDWSDYNSDSAVPGLNRSQALKRAIAIPSDADMSAFASRVRPLLDTQNSAEVENETLSSLRAALLPRLMSGELRVRDAENLVEGAL